MNRTEIVRWSVLAFCAATLGARAEFKVDRSVMSDEYWKVWNDDVQAKIDSDIEKYRKADAAFAVDAPDGTEVKVEQVTSAFFFGAHIFNFNQLGKKEWNDRYKELYGTLFNSATVAFYWRTLEPYPYQQRFEERYEDTEDFWNGCADPKHQPHWRRPAPDPVISFLKTRGCRIHGHPLVWGNNAWHTPTWLWDDFCPDAEKFALEAATGVKMPQRNIKIPICVKDMQDRSERVWAAAWKKVFSQLSETQIAELVPSYVKAQEFFYEKRIREIGERYGSRVDSWDVVNESATDWGVGSKRQWPTGESSAKNSLPLTKSHYGVMPANYAYKGLVLARKYMRPDAWLNVNEYNMSAFPGQIRDLEANGADFQVVGSQMHLFNPAESKKIASGVFSDEVKRKLTPEGIWDTFRRVAEAGGGRPIHLSEITITAPDNTESGQMVQAIIMRNAYRIWFSIEKMNGITWWNVVDDCGAPGEPSISGLFTRDMKPKAAYYAMDDLVNNQWKTRIAVKSADGKVKFRGFRGHYRLSWKDAAGKTVEKTVDLR
ncbi:MAG: endo-1,4-beta-xylanase [Kiritimatiellae bacterium]|nr:endo-1,4-beta-xylanase [Kiritimatiellia bacterium]